MIALALLAGPASARAGTVIEASAGSGFRLDPSPVKRIPTNLMLAGGFGFAANLVQLELGAAANLADVDGSRFDLELRPMIVISPPVIPFYIRGILGFPGLVHGDRDPLFGGALGASFGALGTGVFLEAGLISRASGGDSRALTCEGRLGVYFK